jgi:hypothetical protein
MGPPGPRAVPQRPVSARTSSSGPGSVHLQMSAFVDSEDCVSV